MKNTRKILGIIALAAVIGFTLAACKEAEDEKPSVSISGTPKVGEKLTATSTGGDFNGDFKWSYGASEDATSWNTFYNIPSESAEVSGEFDSEITISPELNLVGKYIRVNRASNSGNVYDIVGPVEE